VNVFSLQKIDQQKLGIIELKRSEIRKVISTPAAIPAAKQHSLMKWFILFKALDFVWKLSKIQCHVKIIAI